MLSLLSVGEPVMKFYYCESCGKRVTDFDIEAGAARDKKLRGIYCTVCSKGVFTVEFSAMSHADARKILAKIDAPTAAVPKRTGSGSSAAILYPQAQMTA